MEHSVQINGIRHVDTDPNIVTVHLVDEPNKDYLAYTVQGVRCGEEVPVAERERIRKPGTTSEEVRATLGEYNPEMIVFRHFMSPEMTDSGEPEPHKTYGIYLSVALANEYRDGFGKIARYLPDNL